MTNGKYAVLPTELTVCMHTRNAFEACDFARVMRALWYQGIPINLRVADNCSHDPTVGFLKHGIKSGYWSSPRHKPIPHVKYVGQVPHEGAIAENSVRCKMELLNHVDTPYVFFLDQDVVLPSGGLRMLLEEFKLASDKPVALAIPYRRSDHPKMGAMLMNTDFAKQVPWDSGGRCECLNLIKHLNMLGLVSRHWSHDIWAIHLKDEGRT